MALNKNRSSVVHSNEIGIFLSTFCIGILVVLLVAALSAGIQSGPMRTGRGTVLLGLYIMTWGCMYLASYYFSHKAIFFRVLMWQCKHASAPAGRKMAFFYFLLAFIIGFAALLGGLGVI